MKHVSLFGCMVMDFMILNFRFTVSDNGFGLLKRKDSIVVQNKQTIYLR